MAPSIDTQIAVKKWEPTAKQVQFLSIPDTVFEGLFGGAAGGECGHVLQQGRKRQGYMDAGYGRRASHPGCRRAHGVARQVSHDAEMISLTNSKPMNDPLADLNGE